MACYNLSFHEIENHENRTYTVVKKHLQNVRRLNQSKVHTTQTNLQSDVPVDSHRHVHARKKVILEHSDGMQQNKQKDK